MATMKQPICYTPDGELFYCRDREGRWYHTTAPEQYASGREIRAALQHYDNSKYPLPSFDVVTGQYYWPPDADDQYGEDEISGDLAMIGWPAECVPLLLELARLRTTWHHRIRQRFSTLPARSVRTRGAGHLILRSPCDESRVERIAEPSRGCGGSARSTMKNFWSERDPKRRARLKAAWEAKHPERPEDSAAEAYIAERCKLYKLTLPPDVGVTRDVSGRIVLYCEDRNAMLPADLTRTFLKAAIAAVGKKAIPQMNDFVPGYTQRDREGNLIGYMCPISRKAFRGENAEREQYHHTSKIMWAQGDNIPLHERMQIYRDTQC